MEKNNQIGERRSNSFLKLGITLLALAGVASCSGKPVHPQSSETILLTNEPIGVTVSCPNKKETFFIALDGLTTAGAQVRGIPNPLKDGDEVIESSPCGTDDIGYITIDKNTVNFHLYNKIGITPNSTPQTMPTATFYQGKQY